MRATIFCNHYQAMSDHAACKAGVNYDTMKGVPFDQRPCFAKHGKPAPGGCDLAAFPTAEELAARDKMIEQMFAAADKARTAIVESLGGPWKQGAPGASGRIDCPVCGGKKSLRFSRASVNGHIHAGCTTEGCVQWME